ncbi:MAG: hypothetical protein QXN02_05265 [Ignisphaera sp.]
MEITQPFVIAILLTDAILWGIWFGGLWSYRSAFASRLTESYIHVSISFAMPLALSSITYVIAIARQDFIRRCRVEFFKISILLSRVLYVLSSLIIYVNIFSGLELLYLFSILLSIGYAISCLAGIAWTDYVADNIHDSWKPRYIALDTSLSTVGSLIGTLIAGMLFLENVDVSMYGKLFLIISMLFLTDIPLILMLKELTIHNQIRLQRRFFERKSPLILYIAIVILYISINFSTSLVAPYIIYKLNGDEMWITIINGTGFIASLVMPIVWSEILKKIPSLTLARISIAISAISNIVFPYLKTLELQIVRAFIASAGGIGIWMSLFSHIIRDVDANQRIQHSSTIFLIQSIAPAVAVNIGGIIADTFNAPELAFKLSVLAFATLPLIKSYEER